MGGFIFGSGGGDPGGGGVDWNQVTMAPQFGLTGKKFYDQNKQLREGTILNWDGTVLNGASTDSNKRIVVPATSAKHILGGRYLGRDIEIAAMEAGSASVGINGKTVTLTKQAGYIAAGSETQEVPAGSAAMSRNGNLVTLTKQAGYIEAGTSDLTVPLTTKSATISSNGLYTYTPSSSYVGFSQVALTVSVPTETASLQTTRSYGTISSNGSYTISPSSGYVAMKQATFTVNVPAGTSGITGIYTGSGSMSIYSATSARISCSSGYVLDMAAFVCKSRYTSSVMAGMARKGATTCYGVFIDSNTMAQVGTGTLTASWGTDYVDLTTSSTYEFKAATTYAIYICYHKES